MDNLNPQNQSNQESRQSKEIKIPEPSASSTKMPIPEKSDKGIKALIIVSIIVAILVVVVFLGIRFWDSFGGDVNIDTNFIGQTTNNNNQDTDAIKIVKVTTISEQLAKQNEMNKFVDYDEMREYLEINISGYNNYGYGRSINSMMPMVDTMMVEQDFASEAIGLGVPETKSLDGGAEDFSTTNIQVEEVDEADIIKNDGKYIYAVSKKNLFIINAYPPNQSEILAKIEFKSTPRDIYLNGDKLVVFGYNDQIFNMPRYPENLRRSQYTFFKVFDITDKKNPKQVRDLDFEGTYYSSRMIGDYVYFITTAGTNYIGDPIPVPMLLDAGKIIEPTIMPDMFYFDVPYSSYNFTQVSAINVNDNNKDIKADVYLLGAGQNIYVSQDNIYITYTKYVNESDIYMEVLREFAFVRLPEKDQEKIVKIEATENFILSKEEKMQKIALVFERYTSLLPRDERDKLEDELEEAVAKKYEDISKELERTVIHKINIDKDELRYIASGDVTGTVLNQFSMDEKNGYFRIATTKNRTWSRFQQGSQDSYNNMYVLDKDLKQVGGVEDIASGERIYSVRFIGDRAYMVTFKRVDPLFVIDLKDPANPKILGELKIPGYSSYLHPYDDKLLIGLGKEADDSGRVQGLKLSLFDVSDVDNLKEVDKYEIGLSGSDSIALNDHKAFLFAKNKNLLVIPATLREKADKGYRRVTFRGALVFKIDENGFELKDKIDHWDGREDNNMKEYWYGYNYYDNTIKRSLYMDDSLYTFSNNYIKIHNLETLEQEKELMLRKEMKDDFVIVN